jgi:small subunit ribosomal protein S4e
VLLRNRLKYALTRKECVLIVMQRHIQVDGKVRTDINFPAGFMDVISIKETNETFRLLYDVKGRFVVHRITPEEAKVCGVPSPPSLLLSLVCVLLSSSQFRLVFLFLVV